MLTLGSSVAGTYVIAPPRAAPAAGRIVNGTFSCTVPASTVADTNRISPPLETACPTLSPCAAPKLSLPAGVQDVAFPPANDSGDPPRAAWNNGPYPGPDAGLFQLVRYVCSSKLVRLLPPSWTPGNVRLPVLSFLWVISSCCWSVSFRAGIRSPE